MVEDAAKLYAEKYRENEDEEQQEEIRRSSRLKLEKQLLVGLAGTASDERLDDENFNATYTVNQAIDHMGFGPFQLLLLFYAGLAWAADAMEMMLLSFLGPAVRCDWGLSATQESLITSVVFLGTMAGANTWGMLSDARGRRVGFQACAVFIFVFGLASAAAPSYGWLLAARCVVGVGLGGVPVAFALFAEFCPLKGRGGWLIALQAFWTFGSMAEAALAWGVLVQYGWRTLLALSALPFVLLMGLYPLPPNFIITAVQVLLMGLYPLLPESPHYLAVQGRLLEAQDVLHRMSSWNRRPLPPGTLIADGCRRSSPDSKQPKDQEEGRGNPNLVLSETADAPVNNDQHSSNGVGDMPAASETKGSSGSTVARLQEAREQLAAALRPQAVSQKLQGCVTTVHDLLSQLVSPALRRTTLLLLAIWFSNALAYYGLVLLATTLHVSDPKTACTADGSPNLSSSAFAKIFVTSTAELPGMLVAAVVVELFSRKKTLAAGLALTAACTAALIVTPAQVFLWGSRAAIMAAYAVLFIYTPEVYPTTVRSLGMGVANSFSRIGGLVSPFIAVALVQGGHTAFAEALFAVVCVLAAVATMCLPIETKGRALAAHAEASEVGMADLVPQLQRESPQHSSVFAASSAAAAFTISPRSDSSHSSAFSLGSVDLGDDVESAAEQRTENVQAGLLRPGAIQSDGPLAEDRE